MQKSFAASDTRETEKEDTQLLTAYSQIIASLEQSHNSTRLGRHYIYEAICLSHIDI